MKRLALLFIVFLLSGTAYAQQPQVIVLKPVIGITPDLSVKAQKEFAQAEKVIEKLQKGASMDMLTAKEQELLEKHGESEDGSIWAVEGPGCSWYCGGGPYKVTASSALQPSGAVTYKAENAHDLSFKSAWVEGVEGYGQGQYLLYAFKNTSPRVTTIQIYNGYMKSEEAWKKNSRVKHLLLSVNSRPFARLELQDTRALQTFKLPGPLGRTSNGKDLILKFEILEVYKGDAYEDTAITEIFFDGLDVHCLAKGTVIALEHSEKPIEAITVGERVRQFDTKTSRMTTATVTRVIKAIHSHLLTLKLENGSEITTTGEHPFWIKGKGWSAYEPGPQQAGQVGRYEVGDVFLVHDDAKGIQEYRLQVIQQNAAAGETYTLELDSGVSFMGNGFIVGTEHVKK